MDAGREGNDGENGSSAGGLRRRSREEDARRSACVSFDFLFFRERSILLKKNQLQLISARVSVFDPVFQFQFSVICKRYIGLAKSQSATLMLRANFAILSTR